MFSQTYSALASVSLRLTVLSMPPPPASFPHVSLFFRATEIHLLNALYEPGSLSLHSPLPPFSQKPDGRAFFQPKITNNVVFKLEATTFFPLYRNFYTSADAFCTPWTALLFDYLIAFPSRFLLPLLREIACDPATHHPLFRKSSPFLF